MKYKLTIIMVVFLALFLSAGIQETIQDPHRLIVKISKDPEIIKKISGIPELNLFQDLDTCFLGSVPSETYHRLREQGVEIQYLLAIKDRELFLVQLPRTDDRHLLNQFGESARVEPRIAIFMRDTVSHPRDLLPPSYQLKKLSPNLRIIHPEQRLTFSPPKDSFIDTSRDDRPVFKEIAALVSKGELNQTIQDLQDFKTRYSTTPQNREAGEYIYQRFQDLGLPVQYQDFSSNGISSRNVVAIHQGDTNPEISVIICAHYDSTSNNFTYLAPGADDNASGTAGVIEAARILSQFGFDFSIKFVCFSGEEQGLYGSKHYATQAAANREKIVAALNLDMIGYTNIYPEDLDVVFNNTSHWIGEKYLVYSTLYTHLPIYPKYSPSTTASDHSPFWDVGYDAILGIEDTSLDNPYYHHETDTLDKLDMDFCTGVVKTTLVVAASMAQLLQTPDPPSGVKSTSQLTYSLFSSYKSNLVTWEPGDHTITGYNIYRATKSHMQYSRLNDSPLTTTSWFETYLSPQNTFYYTVTSIDLSGRESNYSIEVREDENNNES